MSTTEVVVQIVIGVVVPVALLILSGALWINRNIASVVQKVDDLKDSHDNLKGKVVYRDVFETHQNAIKEEIGGVRRDIERVERKVG